jgi:hypothetical protein
VPFDLRSPIGWLFTLYGALLVTRGLLPAVQHTVPSLGLNINLVWGVVLLAFGLGMLLAVKRSRRQR